MRTDHENKELNAVKAAFRAPDMSRVYRQFPFLSGLMLDEVRLFNANWGPSSAKCLDAEFDVWLCVSPEGLRAITPMIANFLISNEPQALKSTIVENYMACIQDDPSFWLSEFDAEERVSLQQVFELLSAASENSLEYTEVLSVLRSVPE